MHAFLSLPAEHEMGLSLPNILVPGAGVPPIQVLKQSSVPKAHWTSAKGEAEPYRTAQAGPTTHFKLTLF